MEIFSGAEVEILQVSGPTQSCNHNNRTMSSITGLLEIDGNRPVEIVPPWPEQVFPEHPRNRLGDCLSPKLESKFLVFSVFGALPSTSAEQYIYKYIYCKSRNSG